MALKVMMVGWELPPFNSGGLGVACWGLAKALSQKGVEVTFVLPKKIDVKADFMKILFADVKEAEKINLAYNTPNLYKYWESLGEFPPDYVEASLEYGERIGKLIKKEKIDIIHSHDWLTFPAGIAAKKILEKPLLTHFHSTEYDRTGGNYPNPYVYKIERRGVEDADKIISVSEFTKNILVNKYGADMNKVYVVHNGIEGIKKDRLKPVLDSLKSLNYKIILYLGRITLQKGPDYFLYAAKKVLQYEKKVLFVIAGDGDMLGKVMNMAGNLGIMENVFFAGFVRGADKQRLYQSADLYVMPSVSEPFGITPLEAIVNDTPVIVSKQSGVSEILSNVLKVDYWDTDELANKILAVIRYKPLGNDLRKESSKEIPNINWQKSADSCLRVYKEIS